MSPESNVTTFLFTDIEGSTRLWEQEPERMRPALARHDAIVRAAVAEHGGELVKMTGDGAHAAFGNPVNALRATLALQSSLAEEARAGNLELQVRCGLHAGPHERRDNDFYGAVVNRAARIMSAAHGGQVLLSHAVARHVDGQLPDVSLRDLGPVRLRDLAEPERLYQVVHPRLRRDFPALRSLEGAPNNLPSAITSFVGRSTEVAEIGALLQRTRLLTLVGMGGVGKSRLSMHVAAEAMDDFTHGTWLVDLAPLQDPRLVPQAIASALGVREIAGQGIEDTVLRYVASRTLLVVLDNCEHLLQACAETARKLLAAGPGLRIVATSREPLRIAGETTYLVTPLPVPDVRAPFEDARFAECDSVRLFVDRAAAGVPGFRLDATTAPAVLTICHRLEGIPLALELAAARVRALAPAEMAKRLDDRFRLLNKGDLTALPRQQTLRATIDWSHDMLSPAEAALFRQLAVFAGGWRLEQAEAVGGEAARGGEVVDLLTQLVEKSLVLHDAGTGRYRFLETVRQYARERLEQSGEGPAARAALLRAMRGLAEAARPELVGPDQAAWMKRLDEELENIIAAHAFALESPSTAGDAATIATAVKMYWINRGLLQLGSRITGETAEKLGAGDPQQRTRLLFAWGQLLFLMGRYAEARTRLEQCLALAREIGFERMVAFVLQPLGMAAAAEGEHARALAYLEEALQLARANGDRREIAAAMSALGQLRLIEKRPQDARPLFEQALAAARALADAEATAIALLNVVMSSADPSPAAEARGMLAEALAIAAELRSSRTMQSVLEVCAGTASRWGEWPLAARFFGAAQAQAGRTSLQRDPADESYLAPLMAQARARLGESQFDACEQAGRGLAYEAAAAEAREWLLRAR